MTGAPTSRPRRVASANIAAELRQLEDPAVATSVARQLVAAGVRFPALFDLADTHHSDPAVHQRIEAVISELEQRRLGDFDVVWQANLPAVEKPDERAVEKAGERLDDSPSYKPEMLQAARKGTYARLLHSYDMVYRRARKVWIANLWLQIGDAGEGGEVPVGLAITAVLDDLAAHGWHVVTVFVEESTIISGENLIHEKSTPVRTSYLLRREQVTGAGDRRS